MREILQVFDVCNTAGRKIGEVHFVYNAQTMGIALVQDKFFPIEPILMKVIEKHEVN